MQDKVFIILPGERLDKKGTRKFCIFLQQPDINIGKLYPADVPYFANVHGNCT